jgi:hypothetical protein
MPSALPPPPDELLRVLADPERLAVAGALARAPMTADQLAEHLGLSLTRVRRAVSRLSAARLVEAEDDRRTYRLLPETLRAAALEVGPPREAGVALGAIDEDEEAVLKRYFRAGRLAEIPAKRGKRLVVLTRLALEFEPGIRYPEREVNEVLHRFHDDHVTLRRYLIDEGLLSRDQGQYWRSGGPVEV